MLGEICDYLKNFFERDMYHTTFVINGGKIHFKDGSDIPLQNNQYFRIIGSVFNDGVWKYDSTLALQDETFDGSVWAMAVPPDLLAIVGEIEAWMAKYETVDSEAMSPFQSESYGSGGYSYSKGAGGSGTNGSAANAPDWKTMFASRLNRWRKLKCLS